MLNDITIPPEALEAAYNARRNGDTLEDICLAMLRNWPGIHVTDHYAGDLDNNLSHREITLPLPKEGA